MKHPENFIIAAEARARRYTSEAFMTSTLEKIMAEVIKESDNGNNILHLAICDIPQAVLEELVIHGYKVDTYRRTISW